jgi:hypothetical protein
MSMNFFDVPPDEEETDGDADSPPMFIPPMLPMPCLSTAKTSSGVPVTPSTQSSRTTTHSSSYDSGSLGSSTIRGAYRPRPSWTPTCGWKK